MPISRYAVQSNCRFVYTVDGYVFHTVDGYVLQNLGNPKIYRTRRITYERDLRMRRAVYASCAGCLAQLNSVAPDALCTYPAKNIFCDVLLLPCIFT